MEYRFLGRTGVKVSRLCLGTMNFGGPTPEDESIAIIHAALDGGINFIDTADMYNAGESERIVGKALKQGGRRDQAHHGQPVLGADVGQVLFPDGEEADDQVPGEHPAHDGDDEGPGLGAGRIVHEGPRERHQHGEADDDIDPGGEIEDESLVHDGV